MLLLLFSVRNETFAMAGREVKEVVPLLPIRPTATPHSHVRGVIHLRGRQVPVMDLGLLLAGSACAEAMSTRIIMIQVPVAQEQTRLLGLMAEKVTETISTPPDWRPPPPTAPGHPRRIDSSTFAPESSITWFNHGLLPPADSLAAIFREIY